MSKIVYLSKEFLLELLNTHCFANLPEDTNFELLSDEEKDKRVVQLKSKIAELEEQLKNAIVPKFKYHQVVYVLYNNEIIKGEIDCFDYFNKNYLVFLMKFDLGNEWFYEHEIFATKEEAESKLKELKGE